MKRTSSSEARQHFMVTWGIGTEFGGMTTMCLYRAEVFRRNAGIEAPILTFDPVGTYDEKRESLRSSGLLHTETPLLNLYEYYRAETFDGMVPLSEPKELAVGIPQDAIVRESNDSLGRLFSATLMNPEGSHTYRRSYFRQDGSLFARDETPAEQVDGSKRRLISLFNPAGDVVRQYNSGSRWYRDWLDVLVAGRPSVFVVDSAVSSRFMAKYDSPYAVKAAVYHSNHVGGAGDPFRGYLAKSRKHIAENPHEWDGIVFLTDQQREDFIVRFGQTSNLFTVSNPRSRLAEAPEPALRHPRRGIMLCRLEAVKNVTAAIDIIDEVRKTIPDVTLEIYGDGTQRGKLQSLIESRGLTGNVLLKGYSRDAVKELDTSTFSLLTSKYEGQPLSVMESLSRGCPPVSFDIRYGPGNLIENGKNGYLVPANDIEAAARCVARLCLEPHEAAVMSMRAWHSSEQFGDQAVLNQWLETIDSMWEQQSASILDFHFELNHVDIVHDTGVSLYGTLSWTRKNLMVGDDSIPDVYLQAVPRERGTPLSKPMTVGSRQGDQVDLQGTFAECDLDSICVEQDEHIDFFIVVIHGKSRRQVRIPFGNPAAPLRAYPTHQLNFSLKPVG